MKRVNGRVEKEWRSNMSEGMKWGLATYEALKRHAITEAEWQHLILADVPSEAVERRVAAYLPR